METAVVDKTNISGKKFWADRWPVDGIQAFDGPFALMEELKEEYLQGILPDPCLALEIGCGSGHLGALLADRGFDVVLLDYVPDALYCARNSYRMLRGRERKRYTVGDAFYLPFSDNTFGFVGSCGLIEHFEHPQQVIAELVRVLRPGGIFYADICPEKFSLIRLFDAYERWRRPERWDGWYENKMTKRDIMDILSELDVREISVFSAGVLPPGGIPGKSRLVPIQWLERMWLKPKRFWKSLDNTWVADLLGFYYFVHARKRTVD